MNKINMKNIKIVAQQDSSRYLLSYGNDQASILDLYNHLLTAPMHIESLLGRGYWEDYTGKIDLEKILATIKIETELGGSLIPFRDWIGYHPIEKTQCVVFRQNDADRKKLYQEIQQGRLRQGWGYSEKFSLTSGKEEFIQNFFSVTNNEKAARKQWNVLSRMLHINDGDTIVIPKQPDHNHYLIVKAKQIADTNSCYEFREPLQNTDDYRHVVHIDQENIQIVHYDSMQTPLIIKRLLKSIAYSSPVNFVQKREFIEAVNEVFLSQDKDSLVEAHPIQSKIQAFEENLYQEWVKSVRNLTPSDFEKLVNKYMQDNGFDVLKTNSYDRKGGDIDLLCSKEIQVQTPFEPKTITLTYCIQIKKHQGITNATGVNQLIQMENQLDLEESNLVQKILISLADGFNEKCRDLASENNVLLVNGVEFAQLYFKSL
ncbi:restriction endonuclease [Ferdinandcohnia quinoae]|uniref:Restriction endonuclease n=1 Tax=Fredinandcohnia quinoae TaxID=2918902 RepID=A0AAW5E0M5_9BACI|nr:restriction endonuclease [Fredinandcohnia sp. SECRCQ15]MCH1626461.1 restriction endonuclease [Fredinandcohnia sp. SECRCQ15]